LAAFHLSEFPTFFVTTTVFILTSTWWLPLLVAGEQSRHLLFKLVGLVFAIRYIWLLFTFSILIIGSFVAPDLTLELLNSMVRAISGYVSSANSESPLPALATVVSWIPSYMLIQLLPLVAVALALWLYQLVLQPALAEANQAFVWRRSHWRNVLLIIVSMTLLFLQPLTYLAGGQFAKLLQPISLSGYVIGISALIVLWRANRTS
jgi:hypothetical protein